MKKEKTGKSIASNSRTNKAWVNNKKFKKNKKKQRKILIPVFSIILVCFLTACIILGYVATYIINFENGTVAIDLDEYKGDQSQTSIIYAYDKKGSEVEYARLHGEENRVWVDLDEMPVYLKNAFISLEDKRFEKHHGVDWVRLLGVVKYNFSQGASTITQQLIKNLTGKKDVTVVRKFNEIISALNLEKHYSKNTILEAYLNTISLGTGCYGVETAAETYFGKDVSKLNLAECASLAAITKSPYAFDPLNNPESNKKRQEYCLDLMLSQGVISKEEHDKAIKYKLIFTNSPGYIPSKSEEKTVTVTSKYQGFYVDFVIDSVIDDLRAKYGYTLQQATNKIYYGGLKIYAAVDLDVQKALEDVYTKRITFPVEKDTPAHPASQSAMTVMDYKGRVAGIIGQAGAKKGNRCLNRATDTTRQPGSSIKPLATYAPAIEYNYITWSSKIRDYAFPYQGLKLWPKNVDGTLGSNSKVTVQYAIEKSLNTVPARIIADDLTPATSMKFLKEKFHISTLNEKSDCFLAPMSVGALTNGVKSIEMAAAYACFGNGGIYYKPYCYYKVTNSKGNELLLENKPAGEQVISAETADILCELLQTVPTSNYGTGTYVRKSQIFAKTGTTDDRKDRWFVGGTPYYVSAVWYGYDKPKEIYANINPTGKIFIEVYNRFSKNLAPKKFEKSSAIVQRRYCTISGDLAGDNCKSTKEGWYKMTNQPKECTVCKGSAASTVVDVVEGLIDQIIPGETTTG